MDWTLALFSFSLLAPIASATYNLLLRPLRHISGPLLALVLWLKTRGLDRLLGLLTPPDVQQYYQFVQDSVTDRLELQSQQMKKPEEERRQDLFHFLCEARDPASDKHVYDEAALRAEANLLIIAESDTTAISLSGIIWYLIHIPRSWWTSSWADSRNEEVYGDPYAFRPERWIVDPAAGIAKEEVSWIRSNLYPFAVGPGNYVGQNLAMAEIMITMARTLYRLDIRRAPGSTIGEGGPS
ncbi:benzoate 4-monooxygenase cytochrome P450 [Apiospora kogelbergensis]|uniref:Benzoate 4-monooxygenase cytochrome P450 n=1 Tax=Apiospora kogelbergensis TaxID=1337665 RepID=A0AAW0QIC6_9PEZI